MKLFLIVSSNGLVKGEEQPYMLSRTMVEGDEVFEVFEVAVVDLASGERLWLDLADVAVPEEIRQTSR